MKKLISIAIALFVVAVVAVPSANASPITDLQAQINSLLATLSSLQTQLTALQGGTPVSATGCTITSFTRNLTVGSSGTDVQCLQKVLNSAADTQVATTGVGSPGSETLYFGNLTKAAVVKFQTKYSISPVAGYVGPITRAKLNTMLGTGGTVTPPPVVPTGAGLNVALAVDTPVSSTLVSGATLGQSIAPLAKFTFANGDSTSAKVTQIKLKRLGVSADTTLSNVYLFDGATRLTDAASVSSGIIAFNDSTGLVTVAPNSVKTITVAADIAANVSGQTVGVGINAASDITSTASAVTGVFPLNGNLMTTATGILASVSFAASATTNPTAATFDPQNDLRVWENQVTIGTRAVNFNRISLKEIGTINYSDLQNFRLYVDGIQVGSAVQNLDANGYVTFDLSASPKKLEAGTRVIKVLADVIGGSSRTFSFRLSVAADANFVDTQYYVNVAPVTSGSSTVFSSVRSCYTSATVFGCTINSGVVTITKKTNSPSGNIVLGASNATLATYEVKAAGERVKIETLDVSVVCYDGGITADGYVGYLRNGALFANGVQIGSTSNLYCTGYTTTPYTTFNLGSSLTVDPGNPVTLEVRADIYDADGTDDIAVNVAASLAQTLKARIEAETGNGQALVSLSTLNIPSADTDGNTLTVKQGSLTLSQYTAYAAQTVVAPVSNYKLAAFTLKADTTETVNVSSIDVVLNAVSSYTTSLYVKYGTQTTTVKPTVSTTATDTWSINYTLPAGQTIPVEVYGDVSSSMTSGTGQATVKVYGTTASSAATANSSSVAGQAITFSTGSLTIAVDGTSPSSQLVAAGQQVTAGKWKFQAANDAFTITELKFTGPTDTTSTAIKQAILKDGSTQVATATYNSASDLFDFDSLTIPVSNLTTPKVLTLVWDLNDSGAISSDLSNSQANLTPTLSYAKYTDSQGNEPTTSPDQAGYATGKAVYVFRTVPTITKVPITTSTLTTGDQNIDLYSFKVKADAKGDVAIKQIKLGLTWADYGSGSADSTLYLYGFTLTKDGADVPTATAGISDEDGHDLKTATAANGASESSTTVIIQWTTEDTVAAGTESTYVVRAITNGFHATDGYPSNDAVSTSMAAETGVNAVKYIQTTGGVVALTNLSGTGDETARFIWSDISAAVHTDIEAPTTGSTGDWANGYLVQSLPLSTVTWVGP